MLIALAGLPATGKSALARLIADACTGVVLNKDSVRATLFPADQVEYSTRQDDFCMSLLFQTATYMLRIDPSRRVIIDGRTFARRYQVADLERVAAEVGTPLKIIECVCSDETARLRLERREDEPHPAGNRDYQLYLAIKARFEPIREPKLVVNTDNDLEYCLERCLAYLSL